MMDMNTNPIVAEYVRIVRGNDAVQAVLEAIADPDERAEIVWELSDTAISLGLGGDPNDEDAFDHLFSRCRGLVDAVRVALS